MPFLQLKLVSKSEIGQNSSCSFTHLGGSIGRSNDCDWTLLDVDRYISNKHALITYQNEQFTLTDTSSNGVFVNNASSAIGKQNSHVLKQSDSITIGKHHIEVESIETSNSSHLVSDALSPDSDNDLLGLVMGGESNASEHEEVNYLKIPQGAFDNNSQVDDGLGLNDILSSSVNASAQPISNNQIPPAENYLEKSSAFNEPQKQPESNQHYVANDAIIPEDWELSSILPAISDYQPPNNSVPAPEVASVEPVKEDVSVVDDIKPPTKSFEPIPEIAIEPEVNLPNHIDSKKASEPVSLASPSTEIDKSADVKIKQPIGTCEDKFLLSLYKKLGLPKEYLASIDEEAFADDIATVMLSSTKGLMSLLNSRTAFKQESRLSLTSVQPRSNNPIKFSIDPVDTLEMLLLKKKKGYLSAKESYDEAVDDIQLHQMAFLSGLQATLVGVLAQISPESIESKINENGRSFMGLKANAQYWQLYKEKQQLLANSVSENLNEVLSTYFSEAYQAQINNFKNEKS